MIEIDSIVMYLIILFILNFQMKYPFTNFFIFYAFYVSSYDASFSFFSFSLSSLFILMIDLILQLILIKYLIFQIYRRVIRDLQFYPGNHSFESVNRLIMFFCGNQSYL